MPVVTRVAEHFSFGSIAGEGVVQIPSTVATGETLAMVHPVSHGHLLRWEYLAGATRTPEEKAVMGEREN